MGSSHTVLTVAGPGVCQLIVVGCYLEDKFHSGQMLLCELVHNYTNFGTKLAEPRSNK